jgi:glycosyltransferase involved in cell wall biosynthesis
MKVTSQMWSSTCLTPTFCPPKTWLTLIFRPAAREMTGGQVHVDLVPSGHELQRLTRVSRDVARGDFVVGYVGELEVGHGLETLIDALAVLVATRVPHTQLLVVGGGSGRQERLRRAGPKGLLIASGVSTTVRQICRRS